MIDQGVLLTVVMIWTVAALTPGPNFFITVHTAVGSNRRCALCTVLGIVVGTLVWSLSGFLGISLLFKTVPVLYYAFKVLGGIYLIFLGTKLLVKKKAVIQPARSSQRSALTCFRLGLLTNLLNPKTALFMASLFAATIPPTATLPLGAACILVICSISAAWYSAVAWMFSHGRARKLYEQKRGLIEKTAGAIFVGFGVKLAVMR